MHCDGLDMNTKVDGKRESTYLKKMGIIKHYWKSNIFHKCMFSRSKELIYKQVIYLCMYVQCLFLRIEFPENGHDRSSHVFYDSSQNFVALHLLVLHNSLAFKIKPSYILKIIQKKIHYLLCYFENKLWGNIMLYIGNYFSSWMSTVMVDLSKFK